MSDKNADLFHAEYERPRPLREETWDRLAREGRLEEAVAEFVRRRDWVTIVELQRAFEPHMPVRGSMELAYPAMNVIVWAGLSARLCLLLEGLVRTHRLFLYPASPLVYMIDGGMLSLPVARRVPPGGYKKPRWAPVCLRTVPHKPKTGSEMLAAAK